MKPEIIFSVNGIWEHEGSWPVKMFRNAEDAYALERACEQYIAYNEKPIRKRGEDFDEFLIKIEGWRAAHPLPMFADADSFSVDKHELF